MWPRRLKPVAQRNIVRFEFLTVPSKDQLDLITSRISQESTPLSAEGASIALGDYDFPGFGKPNEAGVYELNWRSPLISITKFQAMLHWIGFPNRASSTTLHEDLETPNDPLESSDPRNLSKAELDMLWQLFPEFVPTFDPFNL